MYISRDRSAGILGIFSNARSLMRNALKDSPMSPRSPSPMMRVARPLNCSTTAQWTCTLRKKPLLPRLDGQPMEILGPVRLLRWLILLGILPRCHRSSSKPGRGISGRSRMTLKHDAVPQISIASLIDKSLVYSCKYCDRNCLYTVHASILEMCQFGSLQTNSPVSP